MVAEHLDRLRGDGFIVREVVDDAILIVFACPHRGKRVGVGRDRMGLGQPDARRVRAGVGDADDLDQRVIEKHLQQCASAAPAA